MCEEFYCYVFLCCCCAQSVSFGSGLIIHIPDKPLIPIANTLTAELFGIFVSSLCQLHSKNLSCLKAAVVAKTKSSLCAADGRST